MKPIGVVTTVHAPTAAVRGLSQMLELVVVADLKTPENWCCEDTHALSIKAQERLGLVYTKHARFNHYSRKNIGYLQAMRMGAGVIYDTDDDNAPNSYWCVRSKMCAGCSVTKLGWCNTYNYFNSGYRIWPRGLPLTEIEGKPDCEYLQSVSCPIQQGLAGVDPDVDAIWRLAHGPAACVTFEEKRSLVLAPGVWCPFNSQSTWWWPEVYTLLYLPSTAPFRMTDIWRSFIAQRCMWASELGCVAFHSPVEVVQFRNHHNLADDFMDEVPGYLHNSTIARVLSELELAKDISTNMRACYAALVAEGLLDRTELSALDAWIDDVQELQ